jgi:hypothetical protein
MRERENEMHAVENERENEIPRKSEKRCVQWRKKKREIKRKKKEREKRKKERK